MGAIEAFSASISSNEAQTAQLKSDIAELSRQIASNEKALKEATELRAAEKADNEKTVAEAKEGQASVEFALGVLKDFYDSQSSLLQRRKRYVPATADSSGKTVDDLAPEAFEDP